MGCFKSVCLSLLTCLSSGGALLFGLRVEGGKVFAVSPKVKTEEVHVLRMWSNPDVKPASPSLCTPSHYQKARTSLLLHDNKGKT